MIQMQKRKYVLTTADSKHCFDQSDLISVVAASATTVCSSAYIFLEIVFTFF